MTNGSEGNGGGGGEAVSSVVCSLTFHPRLLKGNAVFCANFVDLFSNSEPHIAMFCLIIIPTYFIDSQKDEECMTIYLLDRRVASLPPRRLDVRPIVRHGRVFRRRQRRTRGQGVPAGLKYILKFDIC